MTYPLDEILGDLRPEEDELAPLPDFDLMSGPGGDPLLDDSFVQQIIGSCEYDSFNLMEALPPTSQPQQLHHHHQQQQQQQFNVLESLLRTPAPGPVAVQRVGADPRRWLAVHEAALRLLCCANPLGASFCLKQATAAASVSSLAVATATTVAAGGCGDMKLRLVRQMLASQHAGLDR